MSTDSTAGSPVQGAPSNSALTDGFGRQITYLRLSVTDRCDFRCVYCMAEEMTFLPRAQLLSLEEMALVGQAFSELGVTSIRITGGEPLVRRNVIQLFDSLGQLPQLQELTLTTNGSQLSHQAQALRQAGVKRLNISLDSLKPERFKALTRTGDLKQVLAGIEAAQQVGFERIKLNSVILKHRNADEVVDLVGFALEKQLDISFIEEMPLGHIDEHQRSEEFYSSDKLRKMIGQHYMLMPSNAASAGPSRYWQIAGSDSRIGFISPHSDNFCSSCNRVRVTAEGKLLLCLGNENSVDLKAVIRRYPGDSERLKQTIIDAMQVKPQQHHFDLDDSPQIIRFMNSTGG